MAPDTGTAGVRRSSITYLEVIATRLVGLLDMRLGMRRWALRRGAYPRKQMVLGALTGVLLTPRGFAALVVACLGIDGSYAGVIRMDFSGVVSQHLVAASDSYLNESASERPELAGTPFTGYLTYAVDRAEYVEAYLNEYGHPIAQAYSESGCGILVNSLCTLTRGADEPVVLDYRLNYRGTTYSPLPTAFGFSDFSRRINQSSGGVPSGEVWGVSRNQFQIAILGDPDRGAYDFALHRRNITIGAWITDLRQGFYFSAAKAPNTEFIFMNLLPVATACVAGTSCNYAYASGSFDIRGSLTSVSFQALPEPSYFVLGGIAFVAIVLASRRRRLH
jgi:hypothetical protein